MKICILKDLFTCLKTLLGNILQTTEKKMLSKKIIEKFRSTETLVVDKGTGHKCLFLIQPCEKKNLFKIKGN
jgi:hypothetical protein